MSNSNDDYLDTDLTREDYERFFLLDWKITGTMFLAIFLTLSGLFYWFVSSMRANSNERVDEAVVMLDKFSDRPDTATQEMTPLTLEIEEMRIDLEQDQQFILETLAEDSYPLKMDQKLKQRFLQQSFYTELPSDWKQNLPRELRQYKQQKDKQQNEEIRARLARLPRIVKSNRQRVERLEEIRKNMDLPEKFNSTIKRYKAARDRFLASIDNIESAMASVDTESYTRRDLPDKVFRALARTSDPFTIMALQFRRFSGLSSAPASYVYAEQTLRDAQRIDPKNPEVYYQLGRVYKKMGLQEISSEHYLRALRVSRGESYRRRDDIVEMFEKVLEENPGSARAHYDVAFAYYETGQKSKALSHLLRVLEQECSLGTLTGIEKQFNDGHFDRAMQLVNTVTARRCKEQSMVQTLAKKRIEYILEGEPPYYRLTYF